MEKNMFLTTEWQELEALQQCMEVPSKAQPVDEFSRFGDFVANELRNLRSSPQLLSKLKRAIQRSILEASNEFALTNSNTEYAEQDVLLLVLSASTSTPAIANQEIQITTVGDLNQHGETTSANTWLNVHSNSETSIN